jgi:DNA-binding NtrC family response regulator
MEGFAVETAATGEAGLQRIGEHPFDLILLDLTLPGRNGMEILAEIRSHETRLPVIMITAYGTVENAVRAMQSGAANFVQKPWDNEKLLADVRAAVGWRRAEEENIQLKRALKQRYNFENIVGKSEPMLKIFDLVAQVANSRSTVLLQGESGTGKEVIAKALHLNSPRHDRPFVPVNTGSMPTDLLESTLFGHVKGAFTSAIASKKGLFEMADRGTLFLDEIATMSLDTQAKILRVLQDRRFMHLGGVQEVQVDVRIIAATNVDLRQAVREGRFREDLFYRLNVITIELPPLAPAQRRYSAAGRILPEEICRGKRPSGAAHHARSPAAFDVLFLAGQRARTGKRDRARRGAVFRHRNRDRPAARQSAGPGIGFTLHDPPAMRRCLKLSKTWSGASSPTCWRSATGTRPKPPSTSKCRSPR